MGLKEILKQYSKSLSEIVSEGKCILTNTFMYFPVRIKKLDSKGEIIGYDYFERAALNKWLSSDELSRHPITLEFLDINIIEEALEIKNINDSIRAALENIYYSGDVKSLNKWLDAGGSIDVFFKSTNTTALFEASRAGDIQTLVTILAKNPDVNLQQLDGTYKGFTALEIALYTGNEKIVNTLLQNGASVENVQLEGPYKGCTPLFVASTRGHIDFVVRLLSIRQNLDKLQDNGEYFQNTALYGSYFNNHYKITHLLLKAGAKPDAVFTKGEYKGCTQIFKAVVTKDKRLVYNLAKLYPNINKLQKDGNYKGLSALSAAVINNDFEMIKLLSCFKDIKINLVNSKGVLEFLNPICIAATSQDLNILKLLYEVGANLNYVVIDGEYQGKNPLLLAISDNCPEIVEFLLDNGAFVNYEILVGKHGGLFPLVAAVLSNNLKTVEIILNHPEVDINKVCNLDGFEGYTSLDVAKSLGFNDIALAISNKIIENGNRTLESPKSALKL